MPKSLLSRREVITTAMSSVTAGLAMMAMPDFVFAGEATGEELVPFQNEPRTQPNSLDWETLTEWLTPEDQAFSVQHYGIPKVGSQGYELEITGLVERPRRYTLDELKALPH
ncbi:MAG: hypothetical protein WD468_09405 [Pirellulales bacterium]